MKKSFLFFVAAFVALFMASCGGGGSTEPTFEEPTFNFDYENFNRAIVLEQFTGQSCGNCPRAEKDLDKSVKAMEAAGKEVVWITHHVGFYEDDLTIAASKPYTAFFGPSGTYAPAAMIDRTNPADVGVMWSSFGSSYGDYEGYPAALGDLFAFEGVMEKFAAVPAVCNCFVGCYVKGNELNVTVTGKFKEAVEGAALNVFLLQDSIVAKQSGGSTNYNHMHTMRYAFTEKWGDAITLDADNKYTVNYTYVIPEEIAGTKNKAFPVVVDNLTVAAFVSTHTNDVNNSKILNGGKFKVKK